MGAGFGYALYSRSHDERSIAYSAVTEEDAHATVQGRPLALLAAAVERGPVAAQSLTGSITGTVRDEQGGVLPGVTVTPDGQNGDTRRDERCQRRVSLHGGRAGRLQALDGTERLHQGEGASRQHQRRDVEITIDLTMKVGALGRKRHGRRRVAGRGRQEQRDRDHDLAVAALQRADHPHRDQRAQLRAGHQQQLGVRRRAPARATRCSSTASTRATRTAARPGRSTTTTWSRRYQFQGLGAPAEYGGFTGAVVNTITKSGGNRYSGLFDFFGTNASLGGNNVSAGDRGARTRSLAPIRRTRRSTPTSRPSSAGRSSTNKLFFFVSAQRFLLDTDPTGRVDRAARSQPAAQRQAHLAAQRRATTSPATSSTTPTTSSGAAGARR